MFVSCGSRTLRGVTEGESRSPDSAVHHEVDRGASWELSDGALLHWRVDFDLPHVCVSAVLVVGKNRDLDHEGADRLVRPLIHQRDVDPAAGLHHLQLPDFLKVVKVVAHSDRDLTGRVALVRFIIGVNTQHLHRRPPPELYVD